MFRVCAFMVATVHAVVQPCVCQLYASAVESALVRVRPECAQTAYLYGLSDAPGPARTVVFLLVMSRGKRFESARRLSGFGLDKRNTLIERGPVALHRVPPDTTEVDPEGSALFGLTNALVTLRWFLR